MTVSLLYGMLRDFKKTTDKTKSKQTLGILRVELRGRRRALE